MFSLTRACHSDKLTSLLNDVLRYPEFEEILRYGVNIGIVNIIDENSEKVGFIKPATDYEMLIGSVDLVIYIDGMMTKSFTDEELKMAIMHLLLSVELNFTKNASFVKIKRNVYHELNLSVIKRFGKELEPYKTFFDRLSQIDSSGLKQRIFRPMAQ